MIKFNELNDALGRHNAADVGSFVGRMIRATFDVEIPTYNMDEDFPYEVSYNIISQLSTD